MRGFADLVARRWQEPDAGIWEIRDDAAQHVHSKLMGWLALDRALRIADTHHLSGRQRRRWQDARDAIADEVTARGFDPSKGSYTRSYGSTDLDAALLVLPLLGIEERRLASGPRHDRRHPATTCPPAARCSTATRPDATACPAPKAPSCPARSGSSKRSPAPDDAPRPSTCSRHCSSAPAHSASTPRRWTPRPARTSATTRRR